MKRILVATVVLFLAATAPESRAADIAAVCFTPGGECTNLIVQEIQAARQQVLVQAYSFTSAPIADALVKAKRRGVDVQAVLDKGQRTGRYSGATFLANGGVPVLIDTKHAIAHNKIMVIDGATVITGSFTSPRQPRSETPKTFW